MWGAKEALGVLWGGAGLWGGLIGVRFGDSGWCGGGPPDADAVIDAAYL